MKIEADLYNTFKVKEPFKQELLIDNFYEKIDIVSTSENELEEFLKSAYETAANNYLKRSVLIIICDLTLCDTLTNSHFSLNYLLKIFRDEADPFLLTVSIKYITLISNTYDPTFIARLKELSDNENGDIASEALYWLGFIELQNIKNENIQDLIPSLNIAKKYFTEASIAVENRVDALFYIHVIDFIEHCLKSDATNAEMNFREIEKSLLTRRFYEWNEGHLEFDFLVFQILQNIHLKYKSLNASTTWIDFKEELNNLLSANRDIEKVKLINGKNKKCINQICNSAIKNVSKILYRSNLSNDKPRILNLKSTTEDSDFNAYLDYVIELLPDSSNTGTENHQLLLALTSSFGEQDGLLKYGQIKNKENISEIITAFSELKNKNALSTSEFIAGSITGQEIYYKLKEEIESKLTDYSNEKLKLFLKILEEVIRYSQTSFIGSSKSDYLFLYSESEGGHGQKAVENDLQDSLYKILKLTSLAPGLEHEKAKFVDGGRVDIVFKNDLVTFPIELKRTQEEVTIEKIEKNYLSQAQTYAAGYDQLGIFILLDLSDKGTSPSLNFKDWFHVHHIKPATGLTVKHPDYIISVVIPGNKLLPSSKSKYN